MKLNINNLNEKEYKVIPSPEDKKLNINNLKESEYDILPNKEDPSMLESGIRGAAQEASFGLSDEITGGLEAAGKTLFGNEKLTNLLDNYRKHRDESRSANKLAEDTNPISYTAGQVVGGIAPALLTGGATAAEQLAVKGLSKSALKAGAVAGAKYGATQAFGRSESDLTKGNLLGAVGDTAEGAAYGAVGGTLTPVIGKGLSSTLKKIGGGVKNTSKFIAKKLTKLDENQINKIMNNPKAVKEAKNIPELVDDIVKIRNKLSNTAYSEYEEATNLLSRNKTIKKDDIAKIISSYTDKTDTSTRSILPKLKGFLRDLDKYDNKLSELEVRDFKKIISGVAYDSDKTTSAGKLIQKLEREIHDDILIKSNPVYKDAMNKLTPKIETVKSIDKKFGLKTEKIMNEVEDEVTGTYGMSKQIVPTDSTAGTIKGILNIDKGKYKGKQVVAELEKLGLGGTFMQDIENYGLKEAISKTSGFDYAIKNAMITVTGMAGLATGNPVAGAFISASLISPDITKFIILNWDKIPKGKLIKKLITSKAFQKIRMPIQQQLSRSNTVKETTKDYIDLSNKQKHIKNTSNIIASSSEQIKEMADKLKDISPKYSKTLLNSIDMPDRRRKAVMYSLMQQPAFREVIK